MPFIRSHLSRCSRRRRRRLPCVAAIAVALALTVASSDVSAQDDIDEAAKWAQLEPTDDYDPANNRWNGLTTLVALARGMGISIELRQDLRWEELGTSDVLFVLYPTSPVLPRHLTTFLRGGGNAVIGDDFGRSDRLFAELGLLRAGGVGAGASSYYNDLAFAPMADAVSAHPLARDAPQLATNHPAVFTELGFTTPIYAFGRAETVVSAGELGSGRLVALADPSILINRMLQFDGNFSFAINLLRYLSAAGSRRIVVVTGRFRLGGEPIENDRSSEGLTGIIDALNEWLAEINQYAVTRTTARGLGVLIAGFLAFALLLVIPLRAKSELDGNWTRARPLMIEPSHPESIVELFDRDTSGRQSFALAASALRDGVARRLADELGLEDPFHGVPEHVLYRELGAKIGAHAVATLRPIYQKLNGLPTSETSSAKWDSRFISQRDFERLSDATVQLYRSLEHHDAS